MNLNEVNINGLEDLYRDIKKASKANVKGLSGNTALGKNWVLKVLAALNDGDCDYNSAIDAIETIFMYGLKKEIRTNKAKEQSGELENESLKVRRALNILKENGYIVKEGAIGLTDWTPGDIFTELYNKIYKHWLDADIDFFDLQDMFQAGFENNGDWQNYRKNYANEYNGKELDYLEIAYDDGVAFSQCKNDDEVNQKLADKFDM